MENILSTKHSALKELASIQLKFALLREPSRRKNEGDVDILVSNVIEADSKLIELGYVLFSTQESNRKYIKYDWCAEEWIHLDAQNKLFFGTIEAPAEFIEKLLARSELSNDGIPRVNAVDEAILLIFHTAINKGCLSSRYRSRIFSCDIGTMQAEAKEYSFLPRPLDVYLQYIRLFKEGKIDEKNTVNSIRESFNLRGFGQTPLWKRVYRRLKVPMKRNPAVVFLGADGAGKSTLTEYLARLRWPPVRRQYMGPSLEGEVRPLLYLLLTSLKTLRDKYSKMNLIGLVVRTAWQILCYIDFIERLYKHTWYWGSGGVVIFDRYACDMFFRKPTWLNEMVFLKLFPKPKIVFLCVGDAVLIHRRKPELTIAEIDSTINLYREKLLKYRIRYIEVNTTSNAASENIIYVVSYLIDNNWFKE